MILKQNVSAEKEGLYKALATQLGFARMGDAMYERFDEALRLLRNKVVVENGLISLKQS